MCPEKYIQCLHILKSKHRYVKSPVIKFVGHDCLPTIFDLSKYFDKIQLLNGVYDMKQVIGTVKDFHHKCGAVRVKIQNFKIAFQDGQFTKPEIVNRLEKIISDEELQNIDFFFALSTIKQEINDMELQKELNKNYCGLRIAYRDYLKQVAHKINDISLQDDEVLMQNAWEEIEQFSDWFYNMYSEAIIQFSDFFESKIDIIKESIRRTILDVSSKINEMVSSIKIPDADLDLVSQGSLNILEYKLNKILNDPTLKNEELEELGIFKQQNEELHETLVKIDQFLKRLYALEAEERKETKSFDDYWKNELRKTLIDYHTSGEQKLHKIEFIRNKISDRLSARGNRCEKIKSYIHQCKISILVWLSILGDKKMYFTDEKGKYYLDIFGDKIYCFFTAEHTVPDWVDQLELEFNESRQNFSLSSSTKQTRSDLSSTHGNGLSASTNMTESKEKSLHQPEIKDSDYLKSCVGLPLTKALSQVVLYQPADPIKYLACYLLNYRRNMDRKKSVENNIQERIALSTLDELDSEKLHTSLHTSSHIVFNAD